MVIGVQIIAEFALLLSKIPIDKYKLSNRGYLWPVPLPLIPIALPG